MNQLQQQVRFSQLLADFWLTRGGLSILKKQSIHQTQLNPFKLYKSVCKRGGAKAVTNSNTWSHVLQQAVSPDLTNQQQTIKKYYMKVIYPYERKVYFGYDEGNEQPDVVSSRMRGKEEGRGEGKGLNMQTKSSIYREQEEQGGGSLVEELGKYYEKEEKQQQLYYLRKTRMQPTPQQLKRIQIGLPSSIPSQIMYSLNMLLLYSITPNNNLLFDQFPSLIRTFQTYIPQIYPPTTTTHLQHLKTLTLIIRNFCISTSYLQLILKTELFSTLVDIYNKNVDKECSKNVVEIMTGLVKVGWDVKVIVGQIMEGVLGESQEEVEIGVDLVRGLVEEREQTLEQVITQNLDVFAKLIVSGQQQTKQTVMEILAYISDLSSNTRTSLAKHPYLVQKLVQILGSGLQQKLCDLSALTLSNISVSPGAKEFVKQYERELVMIAAQDERVGNVAAGILAELDAN